MTRIYSNEELAVKASDMLIDNDLNAIASNSSLSSLLSPSGPQASLASNGSSTKEQFVHDTNNKSPPMFATMTPVSAIDLENEFGDNNSATTSSSTTTLLVAAGTVAITGSDSDNCHEINETLTINGHEQCQQQMNTENDHDCDDVVDDEDVSCNNGNGDDNDDDDDDDDNENDDNNDNENAKNDKQQRPNKHRNELLKAKKKQQQSRTRHRQHQQRQKRSQEQQQQQQQHQIDQMQMDIEIQEQNHEMNCDKIIIPESEEQNQKTINEMYLNHVKIESEMLFDTDKNASDNLYSPPTTTTLNQNHNQNTNHNNPNSNSNSNPNQNEKNISDNPVDIIYNDDNKTVIYATVASSRNLQDIYSSNSPNDITTNMLGNNQSVINVNQLTDVINNTATANSSVISSTANLSFNSNVNLNVKGFHHHHQQQQQHHQHHQQQQQQQQHHHHHHHHQGTLNDPTTTTSIVSVADSSAANNAAVSLMLQGAHPGLLQYPTTHPVQGTTVLVLSELVEEISTVPVLNVRKRKESLDSNHHQTTVVDGTLGPLIGTANTRMTTELIGDPSSATLIPINSNPNDVHEHQQTWRAIYEHPLTAATTAMLNISGAGTPDDPTATMGFIYEYCKLPPLASDSTKENCNKLHDIWQTTGPQHASILSAQLKNPNTIISGSGIELGNITSNQLNNSDIQGLFINSHIGYAQTISASSSSSSSSSSSAGAATASLNQNGNNFNLHLVKREPEDLSYNRKMDGSTILENNSGSIVIASKQPNHKVLLLPSSSRDNSANELLVDLVSKQQQQQQQQQHLLHNHNNHQQQQQQQHIHQNQQQHKHQGQQSQQQPLCELTQTSNTSSLNTKSLNDLAQLKLKQDAISVAKTLELIGNSSGSGGSMTTSNRNSIVTSGSTGTGTESDGVTSNSDLNAVGVGVGVDIDGDMDADESMKTSIYATQLFSVMGGESGNSVANATGSVSNNNGATNTNGGVNSSNCNSSNRDGSSPIAYNTTAIAVSVASSEADQYSQATYGNLTAALRQSNGTATTTFNLNADQYYREYFTSVANGTNSPSASAIAAVNTSNNTNSISLNTNNSVHSNNTDNLDTIYGSQPGQNQLNIYDTSEMSSSASTAAGSSTPNFVERYVRQSSNIYQNKGVIAAATAAGLTVDLPSPDSGIGTDAITPRDQNTIQQTFDYAELCQNNSSLLEQSKISTNTSISTQRSNNSTQSNANSPALTRSRPWHDFGRQNDSDKIQIPKLYSPYGFRYHLEAPISTSQRLDEDRITYINKGQFYGILMDYVADPEKQLKSQTVKSVIMLMFREEKSPEDEIKAWQFWHGRQHSVKQRILDADTKNSIGIVGCIEEVAHNAIAVYWNPLESGAKISVAIQCLSTDFSSQKGVKGLPLHLQIDTYEDPREPIVSHRGYCQIKVFCDKGAERKTRDEERRAARRKSIVPKCKKVDEYHTPSEKSEFYSMSDLTKPPVLFAPVEDFEKVLHFPDYYFQNKLLNTVKTQFF